MDRRIAVRAGIGQALAVGVVFVVLALALPKSFFEDWGWLAGPGAWVLCATVVGRWLALPLSGVLIGAALAGIPAVIFVVVGLHDAGTIVAVLVFALWCGRLAFDLDLPAEVV